MWPSILAGQQHAKAVEAHGVSGEVLINIYYIYIYIRAQELLKLCKKSCCESRFMPLSGQMERPFLVKEGGGKGRKLMRIAMSGKKVLFMLAWRKM